MNRRFVLIVTINLMAGCRSVRVGPLAHAPAVRLGQNRDPDAMHVPRRCRCDIAMTAGFPHHLASPGVPIRPRRHGARQSHDSR